MNRQLWSWAALVWAAVIGAVLGLPTNARAQTQYDVTIERLGPEKRTTRELRWGASVAGKVVAVAASPDGQRVYAATARSGLWRSWDGGKEWQHVTKGQPGDAPRACGEDVRDAGCPLPSGRIRDLAVWPRDPDLVFAVTTGARVGEQNGIWRSANGGNSWTLVHTFDCVTPTPQHAPVVELLFAPDDDTKMWAAGCTVARSVANQERIDAPPPTGEGVSTASLKQTVGLVWASAEAPCDATSTALPPPPPGAPGNRPPACNTALGDRPVPEVWNVAVAKRSATTGERVVWACGPRGLWHSRDGGRTFEARRWTNQALVGACAGHAPHGLTIDPTKPEHVYVATWQLSSGPKYFDDQSKSDLAHPDGESCRVPPVPAGQPPTRTACGEGGLFTVERGATGVYNAVEEPGPPVYWGAGSGDGGSAAVYVVENPDAARGTYFLFFLDRDTVHVSEVRNRARPHAAGWHRMDGLNASELCPNGRESPTCTGDTELRHTYPKSRTTGELLHVDPHALAFTPGFGLSLRAPAPTVPPTYAKNRELAGCASHGRSPLFLANDGGVYRSTDCGRSWQMTSSMRSLDTGELAGYPRAGGPPALYFGTAHNQSWYSLDGGGSWAIGSDNCGDCSGFYAPRGNPGVLVHLARDDGKSWHLWQTATAGTPPDPSRPAIARFWPKTASLPEQGGLGLPAMGLVPITPFAAQSPAIGDLVNLTRTADGRLAVLLETLLPQATASGPGHVTSSRTLTPLPADAVPAWAEVGVQVSGSGASSAVYYVRAKSAVRGVAHLYRSYPPGPNPTGWDCIVPGPATPGVHDGACRTPTQTDPQEVYSFHAHPRDPSTVYLATATQVLVSTSGGATWRQAPSLSNWLRNEGRETQNIFVDGSNGEVIGWLHAMDFSTRYPRLRFAAGDAGVFFTTQGAGSGSGAPETWHRLLDTRALPCGPSGLYFDEGTRALYVSCVGASVLKISPIPTDAGDFIIRSAPPR
jgi:photosystem II stability/assembly factor-like uncharacterized protein